MPLYEYRCSKCERVFEVLQKFAEAPLTVHEGCGGQVEQLISAPAFHLKGTGWYATDYKKTSATPAAGKSDNKSESKSDSKPDGDGASASKSDAKSDSASDSKPAASETTAPSTPASTKAD